MGVPTDHVCNTNTVCVCEGLQVGHNVGETAVLVATQLISRCERSITTVCCAERGAPCCQELVRSEETRMSGLPPQSWKMARIAARASGLHWPPDRNF